MALVGIEELEGLGEAPLIRLAERSE